MEIIGREGPDLIRGWEYKSKAAIFGLPLIHICFKYRFTRRLRAPVFARGIISIGQFGFGVINVSQFGGGLVSLNQFGIGGFLVAQFGIAYSLIAQYGVCLHRGYGRGILNLVKLLY